MRILVLPRYSRLGASSRVRSMQFFDFLSARGIEIDCAPLLPDQYLQALYSGRRFGYWNLARQFAKRVWTLTQVGKYDAIWIEKELFPFLPATAESILASAGIPIMVDYDDAVFHSYDRNRHKLVSGLLSGKIDRVMALATVVTAGNGYLADRARKAGAKRIEVVPTVVDTDRYDIVRKTEDRIPRIRIGWIGSPSTSSYIDEVVGAMQRIVGGKPIQLDIVGDDKKIILGLPVSKTVWAESTEVNSIQKFDIGIMPLRDSPWERGKCGYKLVQCMACGIPVIASPVGVNSEIITHGVDGFLAEGENDWVAAFQQLADDRNLRLRMGQAGRRKVEERYSLKVIAPRLEGILRSIV